MFFKFSGSGKNFESAAGVLSSLDRAESTGARLIGVAGNKAHAPGRVQKHTIQTLCKYSMINLYRKYFGHGKDFKATTAVLSVLGHAESKGSRLPGFVAGSS